MSSRLWTRLIQSFSWKTQTRTATPTTTTNLRMGSNNSTEQDGNSKRPYTIVVEGNIGSGKTTFLQPFLKHAGQVEVVDEPVNKWRNLQGKFRVPKMLFVLIETMTISGHNLLKKMYDDPKRWSMLLQTYVQLTMVQHHMTKAKAPVRIMERSLLRQPPFIFTLNSTLFMANL